MPNAQIEVNGLTPPQDVALGVVVNLSNVNTGGELTWSWTVVSQPEGPVDALVPAGSTATITPKKEGSYLFLLVVNAGTATELRTTAKFNVRNYLDRRSAPAAGETVEQNPQSGWAEEANRMLGDITDLRGDNGRLAGVIAVGGTTGNLTILQVTGTSQIKVGFPGQQNLPTFNIAAATAYGNVRGTLYLLVKSVTNTGAPLAPNANDVVWVRRSGLVYDVPLGGGAVGDTVFVDNTGNLSLTPGTVYRSVGVIVAVSGGSVAIDFNGQPPTHSRSTLLRFGSRDCDPNIAVGYVWPLQYGYATVPSINGTGIPLVGAGVRIKQYASTPGVWRRLHAWCFFHADPRTIKVIAYKNDVAQALQVTLTSTGADTEMHASDLDEAHAVTYAEGDYLDVRVENVTALDTFDQIRGVSATVLEQTLS